MPFNIFIAYDLIPPGQNYVRVQNAIKDLGSWHQFQYSLFYVNTHLDPQEAYAHVFAAMDVGDKLAVIDARGGVVSSGHKPVIDAINDIWFAP